MEPLGPSGPVGPDQRSLDADVIDIVRPELDGSLTSIIEYLTTQTSELYIDSELEASHR